MTLGGVDRRRLWERESGGFRFETFPSGVSLLLGMATERKLRRSEKKPKTDAPVLTLKVDGPGIRRGRIAVPDLIKICEEVQSAVTRQAEALEGRKTVHPGPTTQSIRHECTLDLVGIRKGSTNLDFALSKPQLSLPFEAVGNFGSEVVQELADTITSLGNGNRKRDLDPGVLQSIYGLSSVLDAGRIDQMSWIGPKSGRRRVNGAVNKRVRERAAAHLSKPRFRATHVDGILDMADFSRRDRKCRVDPAVGASVLCTFGGEFEVIVQTLLRQPVRVTGIGRIQPHSDRVDSLEIQKLEPLPSLSLGEGNFFLSPTIEQLASSQGIKPIHDPKGLSGLLADDEVEPFVAEIYESRGKP